MSKANPAIKAFGILAACAVSLLLSACNGGDDASSTGTSGGSAGSGTTAQSSTAATASSVATETMSGPITGFGSVIVDGMRFVDTMTVATVSVEPGVSTGIELRDLALGQIASVSFSEDGATKVAMALEVEAEVIGLVDSVDAPGRRLVVAGQDVRTNTDPVAGPVTVFDGFADLAGVAAGTRVEVHGLPKTDGATGRTFIQATRIERKSDGAAFMRVTGVVANLAGGAFDLGSLRVTTSGATRIVPASATLANGQRVVVWSDGAAVGTTLAAKAIRIRNVPGSGVARLAGVVTDCVGACAASFKVNGLPVDASAARFLRGTAADLANDAWVRIRGTVDPVANRLVASSVEFRMAGEAQVELRGTLSGFVPGTGAESAFSVRGVAVKTDAQTRVRNCAGTLADGLAVEVEGLPGAGAVTAREVKCLPAMDTLTSELKGTVGAVTSAAKTFNLAAFPGLSIAWSDTTTFVNGTAAQVGVGAFVEVEGTVTGTRLAAKRIRFNAAPDASEREVTGMVFGYVPSSGTFQVGPLTVVAGTAALPTGFGDGMRVEVRFVSAGGVNTATRVEPKR